MAVDIPRLALLAGSNPGCGYTGTTAARGRAQKEG